MQYPATITFMTDPICSWCWGMAPEVDKLRAALSHRVNLELKCAGLQVGSGRSLSDLHKQELTRLWQRVAETTGQQFAFALPEDTDFNYHSELACRAIEIVRQATDSEPFDYYLALQEAFYVNCRNIGGPAELFDLARDFLGDNPMDERTFIEQLSSTHIVSATRAGFDWCEDRAISALPTVFLDTGSGPGLVCGGYATADFLVPDIEARLATQ